MRKNPTVMSRMLTPRIQLTFPLEKKRNNFWLMRRSPVAQKMISKRRTKKTTKTKLTKRVKQLKKRKQKPKPKERMERRTKKKKKKIKKTRWKLTVKQYRRKRALRRKTSLEKRNQKMTRLRMVKKIRSVIFGSVVYLLQRVLQI
uniref:Uncharacterized protein n=1 Tax=Cacopsylla melanoneura TaxID=428564 RepID=A0A8D9EFT9_9HEMI